MKKQMSIFLAVLMVLLCITPRANAESAHCFEDVEPESWYSGPVAYVCEHGLMQGTSDTTFSPAATMNRAMLVTVLWRMAGQPGTSGYMPFEDVPYDTWCSEAVIWAWENGIVKGTSDVTFSPADDVTRGQMVTMFARYAGWKGLDTTAAADLTVYSDQDKIPAFAMDAFGWAVAEGIILGAGNGILNPNGNAKRAECAAILQRFNLWFQTGSTDLTWIASTRRDYGLGTSKHLEGEPYVVLFFLDDDESSWNADQIAEYWDYRTLPALEFLEDRAAEWDVDLKFQSRYYATNAGTGLTVRYPGVVNDDVMNGIYTFDILDRCAESLGYATKEEMHADFQAISGQEDVSYLIALNKDGRSYAMKDPIDDGEEDMEYSLLFSYYTDYTGINLASTIAHELLHLYGAEDYYDPFGFYPGREALARKLCPYDIMYLTYMRISDNELGAFTAYTVGWTDHLAEEYRVEQWWN